MNQNIILLVGFVPDTSDEQKIQLHSDSNARVITRFAEIDVEAVEVKKSNIQSVLGNYQSSVNVTFVEENILYSPSFTPNDQYYEYNKNTFNDQLQSQWGLRRVNPEKAWDAASHVESNRIIAILDTGIDPEHPDLAAKIVKPINFTTKNRSDYLDDNGHGTHVAGIAAAITNNNIGISGMSFNTASIMPVKVIGPNGGQTKWIISGILYAVLNGAKVINISFSGPPFSLALQLAINFAWKRGVVIVAAVGNEGYKLVEYPAGYNYVLAVSATNKADFPARFSNYGMNVGIAAPGTEILSTTPTYKTPNKLPYYDVMHGTSQATAFVSGLAILLFSIYSEINNAEVVQIIQKAADPIGERVKQWNKYYGYGLLNAANAVRRTTGRTSGTSSSNGRNSGKRTSRVETSESHKSKKHTSQRRSSNKKSSRRRSYKGRGSSSLQQHSSEKNRSQRRTSLRQTSGKPSSSRQSPEHYTLNKDAEVKKGCFYGQVTDQYGNPFGNALVSAQIDGKVFSQYRTRTNVPIEDNGYAADGMFRLPNLLPGSYDLFVKISGHPTVKVDRATIIGGADTFCRLVL